MPARLFRARDLFYPPLPLASHWQVRTKFLILSTLILSDSPELPLRNPGSAVRAYTYEFAHKHTQLDGTIRSYYTTHSHRTWPMHRKEVKAREEPDANHCHSVMTEDKVINAPPSLLVTYPMPLLVVHHRRSLRPTAMC